jgi:Na+-translocating ferredoxin:NAD+ oxidoreductase RnfD subunit
MHTAAANTTLVLQQIKAVILVVLDSHAVCLDHHLLSCIASICTSFVIVAVLSLASKKNKILLSFQQHSSTTIVVGLLFLLSTSCWQPAWCKVFLMVEKKL